MMPCSMISRVQTRTIVRCFVIVSMYRVDVCFFSMHVLCAFDVAWHGVGSILTKWFNLLFYHVNIWKVWSRWGGCRMSRTVNLFLFPLLCIAPFPRHRISFSQLCHVLVSRFRPVFSRHVMLSWHFPVFAVSFYRVSFSSRFLTIAFPVSYPASRSFITGVCKVGCPLPSPKGFTKLERIWSAVTAANYASLVFRFYCFLPWRAKSSHKLNKKGSSAASVYLQFGKWCGRYSSASTREDVYWACLSASIGVPAVNVV